MPSVCFGRWFGLGRGGGGGGFSGVVFVGGFCVGLFVCVILFGFACLVGGGFVWF